jgi:DNA-binding MarR family transcriptional regulator
MSGRAGGTASPASAEATGVTASAVGLGLAIQRVRARMRAESTSSTGWTISQLSTLSRIIERGPMTASALAQLEHVRPQSIAEIVNALKADGLVGTKPAAADGRKVMLSATAAGRELIRAVTASRQAWLAQAIDAVVRPHELPILAQAIDLLNRLAECELESPAPRSWRA